MSSSDADVKDGRNIGVLSRVIGFGLIGGLALGVVGGIEGVVAFYIFRAIDLALYPHYGAFVMTAVSSMLPIVLTVVGLLVGGIGIACFGGGRRAQESAKAMLSALVRNALLGTALGVLIGGMSGLALGRVQSQEPPTLFATFFAGVFFGFLMSLIVSLIVSIKRKPTAV